MMILYNNLNFITVAPKILGPIYDIKVKAGQLIHIDVDYLGEPDPDITWYNDDVEITASVRTTIDAMNHHTILHSVNAIRSDSGQYKIRAKNVNGEDEARLNVVVLDTPGAPHDFNYDEIMPNSVQISWKPPKDDGGSTIT